MEDPRLDLRNKLLLRLVAPLTLLTFLNALDRANVSYAALQMNRALGLRPEEYGLGVSLFFVGYLPFQLLHTALLRRIGARRWLLATVLAWGAVTTCAAFMQSATGFYVQRGLLGMAESGFTPGIVYIMSQWMPARFRASAVALPMLAVPLSMVCGGPLSGWLMTASIGVPGWRFMFFVEGALTLVVALLTPLWFVDGPERARWLTASDRAWLSAEYERERRAPEVVRELAAASSGWSGLLAQGRLWTVAAAWFGLMSGAYGILFWLPQVLKQISGRSDLHASVMSALPWAALGLGMQVNAWHSDRSAERYLHVSLPALLSAAALALAASVGAGSVAFVLLLVGAFALGAAQGAYWALPTSLLPPSVAARGITLVHLLGSSAGLFTMPMIGWVRARTGSFAPPVYLVSVLLLLGVTGPLWLRHRRAAGARP